MVNFIEKLICLFLFSFFIYIGKSQSVTTLSGKIEGLDQGSNVYLSQSSKGEMIDSFLVKTDSFHFELNISQGDAYFIQFKVHSQTFAQVVYMENGSNIFVAITKDFKKITLFGSSQADEQNDFIGGLLPISNKRKLLENQLVSDKDSLNIKKALKENLSFEENEYYINWIKSHPNSSFSTVVVCFYTENINLSILETLYSSIVSKAKENNLVTQKIPIYLAKRKENEKFGIGKHLSDFVLNDTSNKPQSINKLIENSYVLLDIWATWCSPCRKSIPTIKKIWNSHQQNNFKIISISADTDFKLWKEFIRKNKMHWYHLSDLKGTDFGFMKDNSIYAYPTYILVSPDGNIICRPYDIENVKKEVGKLFEPR